MPGLYVLYPRGGRIRSRGKREDTPIGCLVVVILTIIALAVTPIWAWPVVFVVLLVALVLATAFGLTRRILGGIFRR
jgi:hypothetical protein